MMSSTQPGGAAESLVPARPSTNAVPARSDATGKRKSRPMQWVRKAHMYLGLVLFPWVLFFGVTGILFNHPGIGEAVAVRRIDAEHLGKHTGIAPVDTQRIAREVVDHLRAAGHDYRLDDGFESELHGS